MTTQGPRGDPFGMRLIHAPWAHLAACAALYLLVPIAVATAGVFSSHVWWDLPLEHLRWVGAATLAVLAPLSWRLILGRRGSFASVAVLMGLMCLALAIRALLMRGTLQGVWTLTVTALCVALLAWIRQQLEQPYFEPRMGWFAGLPRELAPIEAHLNGAGGVRVARLAPAGAFVFADRGQAPSGPGMVLELAFKGRKVRMSGDLVRQFSHPGSGWGVGIKFRPPTPDERKDLGDFLNVVWSHGHAD